MRKLILLKMAAIVLSFAAISQTNYNVVFDLTSKDTNAHKTVIRWIKGITETTPDAKLEVVLYSQSLDMALKGRSVVENEIIKLADNKNISFKVCEATLRRSKVDKAELLPGIGTVPDGIYEIITKQREGWGYIKVSQ